MELLTNISDTDKLKDAVSKLENSTQETYSRIIILDDRLPENCSFELEICGHKRCVEVSDNWNPSTSHALIGAGEDNSLTFYLITGGGFLCPLFIYMEGESDGAVIRIASPNLKRIYSRILLNTSRLICEEVENIVKEDPSFLNEAFGKALQEEVTRIIQLLRLVEEVLSERLREELRRIFQS